ncbi:hypothetical protein [Sorangium sp. So ce513]|uniref:hypothetical protein n=1 Tax=Sorangium sp. So ce513 TaxID=3133315 RepID=UPI003F5E2AF1
MKRIVVIQDACQENAMNPASRLLTELSIDPFRLDDFLHDPDPLLAEKGVAVDGLAGSTGLSAVAADETWTRCAACFDPGYDPLPDPDVPIPPQLSRRA